MPYYPPSGSSYPYSAYHPPPLNTYSTSHAQNPTAYPTSAYQTPYPTAVQGYGAWPYTAYSYYAPQQQQQQQSQIPQQQQQTQQVKSQPAKPTTANAYTPAATSAPGTPVPPTTTPATLTTGHVAPTMYTQYAPATTAPTTSTMPSSAPARSYTSSYTYIPSYRDTLAAASSGGSRGVGKKSTFRGLFTKELRNLMYGFGDDRNPANDTVNVMEEILVEYIVDVCQTALAPGKKSRLSIEDLRRVLSRTADAKKLARMEELLFMQEDIKRARAQFEESDMNQASYQS